MAKSRIIKELATDECSIDKALNRLYLIANSLQDIKLAQWVRHELNGYNLASDEIPEYRKIEAIIMGDYQLVSVGKIWTYKHKRLPTIGFTAEDEKSFCAVSVTPSIVSIIEGLTANKYMQMPLPVQSYHMFEKGTNITVLNAYKEIPEVQLEAIVQAVKTRVIDALIFLENEFGCLDDLDVDVSTYEEEEIRSIHNKCEQIVFNGCMFADFTKARVKNSNVGQGNSSERTVETEINSNVTVNPAKKSFWSRIMGIFKRR